MKTSLFKLAIALIFTMVFSSCNQGQKSTSNTENQVDWNLAILAYTFKDNTFAEAIAKAKELGIDRIGGFPGQAIGGGIEGSMAFNMDSLTRGKVLDLLATNNVQLVDFGVISPKTQEEWVQLFEFAKSMGIQNIVSEPEPALLDYISTLCDQYQIKVAIHNHASPSIYWHPDTVMKSLEGKSELMGVCADVGHWYRSQLDPVQSLQKVSSRLFELHFKDIAKDGKDVVMGTGDIQIAPLLEILKQQHFKGVLSLECEGDLHGNVPEIAKSVAYYQQVLTQIP
ncbi:sugar phosphate isomerase/epimerase family protein [Sphingobacterium sp. HJSM2_6]|uniref:sugar phosphate isomerase/epimerase family protein n=1 Tax=Sphingobacterium sp. HJSM2_6 TaxID=3366264 RepID=UPI003BBE2DB4